jgi:hypothetical protein
MQIPAAGMSTAKWRYAVALAALLCLSPLIASIVPVAIHLLLPFPELRDTQHWIGRVEVEGMRLDTNFRSTGIESERTFIVTPDGRHEFSCGYLGARHPCPRYYVLDGAEGEVWFSRTHGVIQSRFVLTQGASKGKVFVETYTEVKQYFKHQASVSAELQRFGAGVGLFGLVVWIARTRLSQHKTGGNHGDSKHSSSD